MFHTGPHVSSGQFALPASVPLSLRSSFLVHPPGHLVLSKWSSCHARLSLILTGLLSLTLFHILVTPHFGHSAHGLSFYLCSFPGHSPCSSFVLVFCCLRFRRFLDTLGYKKHKKKVAALSPLTFLLLERLVLWTPKPFPFWTDFPVRDWTRGKPRRPCNELIRDSSRDLTYRTVKHHTNTIIIKMFPLQFIIIERRI